MTKPTLDENTAALLRRLVEQLEKRLTIIGDHQWRDRDQPGHLAALTTVALEIDALKKQVPRTLDPELTHYLERCSFDKALAQTRAIL